MIIRYFIVVENVYLEKKLLHLYKNKEESACAHTHTTTHTPAHRNSLLNLNKGTKYGTIEEAVGASTCLAHEEDNMLISER